MGQSNIWYADTAEGQPVVESVLALVNGTSRPPATRRGKTDPEHNANVEKAAVRVVRRHYSKLGYAVESVEEDNVGWDLEASEIPSCVLLSLYFNKLIFIHLTFLSFDNCAPNTTQWLARRWSTPSLSA